MVQVYVYEPSDNPGRERNYLLQVLGVTIVPNHRAWTASSHAAEVGTSFIFKKRTWRKSPVAQSEEALESSAVIVKDFAS